MFKLLCLLLSISQLETASPPGDVVGQLSVGYQGWFTAQGDGSPRGIWYHWSNNEPPSPGHVTVEIWPDVSEYQNTYQTGFANLGNGQPAKLFSSWDDQAIDTHFRWMSENGINNAAMQRFGSGLDSSTEGPFITGVIDKAARAAEAHGVKFYVMYDVTSWTGFQQGIKDDWNNNVQRWVQSSAYSHQNGKPVVCIWGLGFGDRPGDVGTSLDVINFLKDRGVYVIGGVTRLWRTQEDCKPGFLEVFNAYDMISPWSVGSMSNPNDALGYKDRLRDDFAYCEQNGKDFQPVLYPGSAWSNSHPGEPRNQTPRLNGDFMWRQWLNLAELGIPSAYVAMFDEYDEGTAIAKIAPTKNDAPPDQYFYTLDEDGVQMSSDFYLRLVHDGIRMVKGEIPVQDPHPTPMFP